MPEEIRDLDSVALLVDVPANNLRRGEVGTIVFDFSDNIFLVEFVDRFGQTYALVELPGDHLLPLRRVSRAEAA